MRYNTLLSTVTRSLRDIQLGLRGAILMGPDLEAAGRSMVLGQVRTKGAIYIYVYTRPDNDSYTSATLCT